MISPIIRILTGLLISLSSGITWGQAADQTITRGEQIYTVTCATGYCHTLQGGAGGGAPRLAARDFNLDYITQTVSYGLHETKMLGFAATLSAEELAAVIAYVASLNGISTDGAPITAAVIQPKPHLSANASQGKQLFHDPLRAFARCATCHRVEDSGVPVAEPLAVIPATAASLRKLATAKIATITIAGDAMPALVLRQGTARTIFYDLTSSPPVRRNVESTSVNIMAGSKWTHSAVINTYSDEELKNILAYLRAVVK